jgi:hypothetical protein
VEGRGRKMMRGRVKRMCRKKEKRKKRKGVNVVMKRI